MEEAANNPWQVALGRPFWAHVCIGMRSQAAPEQLGSGGSLPGQLEQQERQQADSVHMKPERKEKRVMRAYLLGRLGLAGTRLFYNEQGILILKPGKGPHDLGAARILVHFGLCNESSGSPLTERRAIPFLTTQRLGPWTHYGYHRHIETTGSEGI